MILALAFFVVVCVVILILGLCATASGADQAIERISARALGPASSDREEFERGVLLAMDSYRIPHERRHTGGVA